MQHCEYCGARFADQDAYQIHLGIGAPAFHACNDAQEMAAKGMTVNEAGEWSIGKNLIVHFHGWASLKSGWVPDIFRQRSNPHLSSPSIHVRP